MERSNNQLVTLLAKRWLATPGYEFRPITMSGLLWLSSALKRDGVDLTDLRYDQEFLDTLNNTCNTLRAFTATISGVTPEERGEDGS